MLIKPCSIHFISSASSRPVLNSELANCYSMLIRWTKHLRSIRNIREDVYERPLSDKLLLKRDAVQLESEMCIIKHKRLCIERSGLWLQTAVCRSEVLLRLSRCDAHCNVDSFGLCLSAQWLWRGSEGIDQTQTQTQSSFISPHASGKPTWNATIAFWL